MSETENKGREVTAKIVYYGPGLSGKTTNLKRVHAMLKPEVRGKLMALSTQSDRTIFFDYLPVNLGTVRDLDMKIQLYTVPGQVFYNSTRRLVLKNVDGVIFVADSGRRALPDNLESLTNLQENLKLYNQSLISIPWVIQYNKRDLPDALTIADLHEKINRWGVPEFEGEAAKGRGVMETLAGITKLVVKALKDRAPEEREHSRQVAPPQQVKAEGPSDLPLEAPTPELSLPEEPSAAASASASPERNPGVDEQATSGAASDREPEAEGEAIDSVEEVPEIELEVDDSDFGSDAVEFDSEDRVEEIEPEPMAEIDIRANGKPYWKDGVLVVPLEVSINGSEFVHDLRLRLDAVVDDDS